MTPKIITFPNAREAVARRLSRKILSNTDSHSLEQVEAAKTYDMIERGRQLIGGYASDNLKPATPDLLGDWMGEKC